MGLKMGLKCAACELTYGNTNVMSLPAIGEDVYLCHTCHQHGVLVAAKNYAEAKLSGKEPEPRPEPRPACPGCRGEARGHLSSCSNQDVFERDDGLPYDIKAVWAEKSIRPSGIHVHMVIERSRDEDVTWQAIEAVLDALEDCAWTTLMQVHRENL